jgi:hypothetical protein
MHALAVSRTLKVYDEGRTSRRTIADAVEILRSIPGFGKGTRSTIRTAPLPLPSGEVPFLLQAVCEDVGMAVSLPTSYMFRAKLLRDGPSTSEPVEFVGDTCLLEGAIVSEACQVVLSDGRRLRSVEIIPVRMRPDGHGMRGKESEKLRDAVIGHVVRMKKLKTAATVIFTKICFLAFGPSITARCKALRLIPYLKS